MIHKSSPRHYKKVPLRHRTRQRCQFILQRKGPAGTNPIPARIHCRRHDPSMGSCYFEASFVPVLSDKLSGPTSVHVPPLHCAGRLRWLLSGTQAAASDLGGLWRPCRHIVTCGHALIAVLLSRLVLGSFFEFPRTRPQGLGTSACLGVSEVVPPFR